MSEQPMPQDAAQESEQAAAGQEQAAEQPMTVDVILASGSPRRKELLEREGVSFTIRVSEVDESLEPDLEANPPEAVKKLAERKAGAVVQEVLGEGYTGMAAIIGADTMVVCDGEIFGAVCRATRTRCSPACQCGWCPRPTPRTCRLASARSWTARPSRSIRRPTSSWQST